MKKVLKIVLCVFLALVLVVGGYFAYVMIDYHRLEDNIVTLCEPAEVKPVATQKTYSLISYNIGFGAYTPDFGFFMDGGTESRAFSKESVLEDITAVGKFLQQKNADFLMIEEVDIGSTRSYGVEEREMLLNLLPGYQGVFAQNYDSPYLFYPILEPHGKSVSGLLTLSKYSITSSTRRSLPIEESLMKLVDLDRCYSVSRIPCENGKELLLYTVHLSAYTSDGKIAEDQLKMLIGDMQSEYEKGNYCVCGGDFNKDLLDNSAERFGVSGEEYTWAQPIPAVLFADTAIRKIAPFDEENPVPSCRNADGPYHKEQYVVTVDGFLVSDNVEVVESQVIDTGFTYSDHNPVSLTFLLK